MTTAATPQKEFTDVIYENFLKKRAYYSSFINI